MPGESSRQLTWPPVAAAAALIVLAILASPSAAEIGPVGSGESVLRLADRFSSKLIGSGIALRPVGDSRLRGDRLELPASKGRLDPTKGIVVLEGHGGFELRRRARSVRIARIVVARSPRGSIEATVAGQRIVLGSLTHAQTARDGFDLMLRLAQVRLTSLAATRIDARLRLSGDERLEGGLRLGWIKARAQPRRVSIFLGSAKLFIGGGETLAKLSSKGVDANADVYAAAPVRRIPSAEPPGFYIDSGVFGGSIAPDGSAGTLGLAGGWEIKPPGGPAVQFANLWLNFQQRVVRGDTYVDGVKTSDDAVIATCPQPMPRPKERRFAIEAGFLPMVDATANLLNREFPGGTPFVAGDPLVTLDLTTFSL